VLVSGYDMPFLLRVPVMSHDNLRVYGDKFKGQQFDVSDIYTRISFVHGQVGQLDFNPIPSNAPWVSEADAKKIDDMLAKHLTDALVGRGDTPVQGQIAAPAAAVQLQNSTAPATPAQLAPAPTASPFAQQAEPPKPKRTRQPKAEPAAAPAGDENIPPFLRRAAEPVQTAPTQKNTGIVNDAPSPGADLDAALANVFGLPT
jgi:hypothetical protein